MWSVECGVWYVECGMCSVNGVVFFSELRRLTIPKFQGTCLASLFVEFWVKVGV